MSDKVNVFWFRRDLRWHDNRGLFKALSGKYPVLPIFIFDSNILDELPKDDARVTFIYHQLKKLKKTFKEKNGDLGIYHGKPIEVFSQLTEDYNVQHVITNHDYEPYALERDKTISELLKDKNIGFHTFKDQVIFEKAEVVKDDGDPYVVYTPYSRKWLARLENEGGVKIFDPSNKWDALYKTDSLPNLTLSDMGFKESDIKVPDYNINDSVLANYKKTRNFPSKVNGTTQLSPHLRFGTVGIRSLVKKAQEANDNTFLKELIWREFFMQILWHFPKTVDNAFKPKYNRIEWRNNEEEFEMWKNGKTGFPLVDAGMRQLNKSGYMHNRVRMLVASFLCKHLLIDWRWGEAYFAEKLLDYEMSSNVGNWQWAAGSGVDAAPYFRIFNPTTQIEKFDKDRKYIKKWVEEWNTNDYPEPMVDHKEARERCLSVYKSALN